MKHVAYISILFMILVCSCNQTKQPVYSLRDSVLNEYLAYRDSAHYWDTTDWNYKLLKAYQNNDTIFFKALHEEMQANRHYGFHRLMEDSCLHQPSFNNLQADEVYRFKYTGFFCPYRVNITVNKVGSNINLHFIKYLWGRSNQIGCQIISVYDKKLKQKNWDELTTSLEYANFWGLKYDDGRHGGDGDDLSIDGYIKGDIVYNRTDKFTSVYRWNTYRMELYNTITLVFELADYKQDCL